MDLTGIFEFPGYVSDKLADTENTIMPRRPLQAGLTLIEMVLVMGLAAYATLLAFQSKTLDLQQNEARATGGLLFEYNNAVRQWISANPNASNSSFDGSGWLKSLTCGGSSQKEYLRCSFPAATAASPITFGKLSLKSNLVVSGSGNEKTITVTTNTTPFTIKGDEVRSDLAGLAALMAAAGSTSSATPLLMATDGQYKSVPSTGAITMIARNQAANDIWLRTDGGNTMNNALSFNSGNAADHRTILGASRIQALASEIFYIGRGGGALAGEQAIVDANLGVVGALNVQNAANQAEAVTIQRGNLSLKAGSLVANGMVTATGAVSSAQEVSAPIFYDDNDRTYYVDPNQTSVLNSAQLRGSLSVAGRISVGEYLEIQGQASLGAGCSPNGLVARDAAGSPLYCVSGKWSSPGVKGSYQAVGTFVGAQSFRTGDQAAIIHVYGGNAPSCTDDWTNRYALQAVVDGMTVAYAVDNNNEWAKVGYISFAVPANTSYVIYSNPYACPVGRYTVNAFLL